MSVQEHREQGRPHERDYLERTIETVRQHQGADNCWPQWANIFADEIERLWRIEEATWRPSPLNLADAQCVICNSTVSSFMLRVMLRDTERAKALHRLICPKVAS